MEQLQDQLDELQKQMAIIQESYKSMAAAKQKAEAETLAAQQQLVELRQLQATTVTAQQKAEAESKAARQQLEAVTRGQASQPIPEAYISGQSVDA